MMRVWKPTYFSTSVKFSFMGMEMEKGSLDILWNVFFFVPVIWNNMGVSKW